jgi:signal transduction histidine kinase
METRQFKMDELTGLPILGSVYEKVKKKLDTTEEVGFLYFDVIDFRQLEEKYSIVKCRELLRLIGQTLREQRTKLYRDEDLMVSGGTGMDFFVLFLFSPPRKKESFSNHDLKLISTRIKQKLQAVIDENSDLLGISDPVDFHTGYTVIRKDPYMTIERLVYEARKEAGFKSKLEEIMIRFISNVSHELRTPLTSIKGYTETLLEGVEDEKLQKRWLQIVFDEAQRLERLINDLLDLSMLEAEQVDLNFKQFDICRNIDQTVSILQPLAAKENVKIETVYEESLPQIVGDEDRIKQVMLNLIHNAIKFSPRGGILRIQAGRLDREVGITVTDQGAGIPANHLSHIFERFYRVAGKAAGRGLGLTIARHIVEAHGGSIGARSVVGEGSTFFFTLPIEQAFPILGEEL